MLRLVRICLEVDEVKHVKSEKTDIHLETDAGREAFSKHVSLIEYYFVFKTNGAINIKWNKTQWHSLAMIQIVERKWI